MDTTVGACRSPLKPAASDGILQVLKTDWGSVHRQWAGFRYTYYTSQLPMSTDVTIHSSKCIILSVYLLQQEN
jgi:hypothetical protein